MDLKSIVSLYQQGQQQQALAQLEGYLQQHPNDERAWEAKMRLAALPFERQAAMERLLMLNPQHPAALQMQAQLSAPAGADSRPPQAPSTPQQQSAAPNKPASPPKTPPRAPAAQPDEGVFEMLWDCEACGTKGLLGLTHRYCPNCGSQQNPDKRYFPSDEEKVAVKDHQFTGEDVTCAVCKTLNSGKAEYCTNCGAPLSDAAKARRRESESRETGGRFGAGQARDLVKERFEAEMERVKGPSKPQKQGKSWFSLSGVGAAVAACIVLCVGVVLASLFWNRSEGVQVTGHDWERIIEVQSFQTVSEGDWCTAMPSDAFNVDRSERQRDTKQVPDGETCRTVRVDNGDGTYSQRQECTPKYRSEPVYDDYCEYNVNRWALDRRERTEGDSLADSPDWPALSLTNNGDRLGSEREGQREEIYSVRFRADNGDTYECEFNSESRWRDFPIESRWTLTVNVVTGRPDCDDIQAQ